MAVRARRRIPPLAGPSLLRAASPVAAVSTRPKIGGQSAYGGPGSLAPPPPPPAATAGSAAAAPRQPAFVGDAQYFADAAQDEFSRQQKLQGLDTQEQYSRQDLAEVMRRRAELRPRQTQQTAEQYNRSGLLFSGKHTEAQADLATQGLREDTDMQQRFDRDQAARQAARAAIEAGKPLEEAARLAEAISRKLEQDQQAADTGGLAAPSPRQRVAAAAGKRFDTPKAAVKPSGQSTYGPRKRRKR